MAYYGNITHIPTDDDYSNHCVGGKCSGCGECCADILPVSLKDIARIKAYVKTHGLKEHRHMAAYTAQFDPKAVDLTCPFRNETARRCDIYEVRPEICRLFICSKELQQAHIERDRLHAMSERIISFRWEFFGNPEALDLIYSAAMKVMGRHDL